jgi:RNA polymerase sigma-70 factor (ECF subfamily)
MTASDAIAVSRAVDAVLRQDRGRLLAALITRLRDFQLAEDALQEAAISALTHWGRSGLPASPQGWLLRVALRKAIDRLRSAKRDARKTADLTHLAMDEAGEDPDDIPDDRLRLIFTCCHPALDPKSRVALTLRSIAGLTTPEIARAFLDAEPTMGQRLSRAKAKIAAAGIPYAVPSPEDWPDRLQSVLAVIYLIYNAGYSMAPQAEALSQRDLCAEAIFLARLLLQLRLDEPETEGCLALLLLTQSRAPARLGTDGISIPLTEQKRSLWHRPSIDEGLSLLNRAMARRAPGPYQIKAAIAACHMAEPGPDWPQIAALFTRLLDFEPTPIIRLNRAVAVAEAGDLPRALQELSTLASTLDDYQPFHAAQADLLARAGQGAAARAAYDRAIALAPNAGDAAFLTKRRDSQPI